MGKLVDEEVKRLKTKTDDEIMKIYANQLMGGYPQMVVVDALGLVIKERNIEPGNMVVAFNYKDSEGNEKILQLVEV